LACGNVPNQFDIEQNIARAAASMASSSSNNLKTKSEIFCVKLSTAEPLIRKSVAGHAMIHQQIEKELPKLFSFSNYAILRPNVFLQMLDPLQGGTFFGINVNQDTNKDAIYHLLADNPQLAMIDCDDVALCAQTILLSFLAHDNKELFCHEGMQYELTGPTPHKNSWMQEFQEAVSLLRPNPISQIERYSPHTQISPIGKNNPLEAFLSTLNSYKNSTDSVKQITNQTPKTVTEFIFSKPRPFLPLHYSRLVATGKALSFREAAKVQRNLPLKKELDNLEKDELLIRVQVAGVNGGADTFSVTQVSEESRDIPLGNEGTGIVVGVGNGISAFQQFHVGDTVVFVGKGAYGEYVRVPATRCIYISSTTSESVSTNVRLSRELTALRISALTALVALTRTCPVQYGDLVLVTACCGGTGHFAAQIAKNAGATVIGTVGSTPKVATAKSLGCFDRVVDLSKESLTTVLQSDFPQGIDICYEGVGGKLLKAVHQNMADGGRILIVGSISQYPHNQIKESHEIDEIPPDIMADVFRLQKTIHLERNCKLIGNVWGDLFRSGEMKVYQERIFELFREKKLKVLLDDDHPEHQFYGLDSVCNAVDHMLSRKSIGKVTVVVSN